MTRSEATVRNVGVRRLMGGVNLTLFLLSVLAIGVVLNYFSMRPNLRRQIDATKTRAYSLSEQSTQLLSGLEGHWTIALLMTQRNTTPALRRQIDEVLRRFEESAPDLTVRYIDPTDPESLGNYDTLLRELQNLYGELIDQYDRTLNEAEAAFANLQAFAQQQSATLLNLLQVIPPAQVQSYQLQTRGIYIKALATESDQVVQMIQEFRASSDVQPIPDYEGARSTLYMVLRQASNQLDELALIFEELQRLPDLDMNVLRVLSSLKPAYEGLAQQLAIAADPLSLLVPLELSGIGRQIQTGECAVIISPDGAMSIRSDQLFPMTNVQATGDAAVTFDQRFRGEQLIASTIRSMTRERMPKIVFVHARESSIFLGDGQQTDLSGARNILSSARFEVEEWPVAAGLQPPSFEPDQKVVWVIVPPHSRTGLELSEGESRLLEASKMLINQGESVLLNLNPNPLARFGQSDPWREACELLGLEVDSSQAVFESVRVAGGQTLISSGQTIQDYDSNHLIAEALQGLPTYFGLPMPITLKVGTDTTSQYAVIARVEPNGNRWLEKEWALDPQGIQGLEPGVPITEPISVVMAVERPHPIEVTQQRCLVTSSGGWMLTVIADRVYSVGGDRIALEYPGNYELMLASLAWLAGEDELIAPSPMSQEVARLRGVTAEDRRRWFWLTIAGLPGAIIGLGLFTWLLRRV